MGGDGVGVEAGGWAVTVTRRYIKRNSLSFEYASSLETVLQDRYQAVLGWRLAECFLNNELTMVSEHTLLQLVVWRLSVIGLCGRTRRLESQSLGVTAEHLFFVASLMSSV